MVKSPFGYRLRPGVELTEMTPPTHLFTVSRANLDGTGEWEFRQEGNPTYANRTWIVESHHPLLNLPEPIAKPLFARSHVFVSSRGHKGLKALLER